MEKFDMKTKRVDWAYIQTRKICRNSLYRGAFKRSVPRRKKTYKIDREGSKMINTHLLLERKADDRNYKLIHLSVY